MKIKKETVSSYEIECSLCDQTGFIRTDDGDWRYDDTGKKYFERQGWSSIKGKNLCPQCTRLSS